MVLVFVSNQWRWFMLELTAYNYHVMIGYLNGERNQTVHALIVFEWIQLNIGLFSVFKEC